MSESDTTRYERTEDGKWFWEGLEQPKDGVVTIALESAYQLGIQSRPKLLTDKTTQTFGCSVCLLSDCRSCPDGTMPCQITETRGVK